MKTKTFEISNNLFIESGIDLIRKGKKLSNKAIIDNINNALYIIITLGSLDTTVFPLIDDYEEEICMSYENAKKIILSYFK